MKTYLMCAIVTAVGFFATGMQLGLFGNQRKLTNFLPGEDTKPLVVKAKFPQELAPAGKAQPVPVAAAYEPGDRPHKMVFLKPSGGLHAWHDSLSGYHEEWYADSVESTELVVVVGVGRKLEVSHHTYPNGAPPITRYQYDLEASLVEAKTGRVLAHRWFQNRPRGIRPTEAWELTAIGSPVSYQTVFRWASNIAKFGPPANADTSPIITIIE
jgi:hypothetical protein